MLSVGPWTHVLPKPCETMFNMPENLRFLWGVHDEKRARPGTRKEQPGALFFIAEMNYFRRWNMLVLPSPLKKYVQIGFHCPICRVITPKNH